MGCSSCGKKAMPQSSGKSKSSSNSGYRRTMGASSPSSSGGFGKPKIRFSGRGR